jgi:hypothetical protein
VVRELIRVQGSTGPDGSPVVPYIFFVVRPDGIRPYYEARARLESLGIAFGYELVDQEMDIDFPDLDHPDEWDGSASLGRFPIASLDGRNGQGASGNDSGSHAADDFVWTTNQHDQVEGSDVLGEGAGGSGRSRGSFPSSEGRFPVDPSEANQVRRGFTGRGGPATGPGRPTAGTPGMLPPSLGPRDSLRNSATREPAGLPPAEGGGTASASPGSFGQGSPSAGGTATARGHDARLARELAAVDAVPMLGRQAGQGARFRPSGLKPGEPGAPPEELPSFGSDGSGQGQGQGQGQQASASNGSTSPTGSAAFGDPSGRAGGSAAGESGATGEPGAMGAEGEPASPRQGPLRISVPMEIVVACGPSGVTIHPGGYQLSKKTLGGKDDVLARSLRTIVHRRQQVDPMIRPIPSIRFLVEPGGGDTYQAVRRQTVLSGIDWPSVLQVSDTRVLDFLPRGRF